MSSGAHAPRRHFNSRPSARGDRDGIPRTGGQKHFNSRPSARGDIHTTQVGVIERISIHAPPRGATDVVARRKQRQKFQFTPLREGRRAKLR